MSDNSVMMKWFPVCILAFVTLCQNAYAYLGDDMAKTIQFCCNEGDQYAKNFNNCQGTFPMSPEVPTAFISMCRMAQAQCCNEYFAKKNDCESGVDTSIRNGSCNFNKGISKDCCDDCARGTALGKSKGPGACQKNPRGTSAEEILAQYAFKKCCEKAAKGWKENSSQRSSNAITLSILPSTCEDYAPNELCAHHCIPVPGSYKCECNPGFMLMADGRNCKEVTKNRCKPRNDCQHKCNDNGVEVKCSCRRGYELMQDGKSCQDIDECQLDQPVCLPGSKCHNMQGSYRCIPVKKQNNNVEKGKCPPGFTRNADNNACDDINECLLPNPPCPIYICENTVGGYLCGGVSRDPELVSLRPIDEDRCPPGFRVGVNEECEDIDECTTQKHDCNLLSQFCINKHGSFHCQDKASKHCPPGFKINTITNKCEDINECEDNGDVCQMDEICINQLGQYYCKSKLEEKKSYSCPEGMRKKEGSPYCEDIDECAEGLHICDINQSCLNTNGSYDCHCKRGYELDVVTQTCVDTNECATMQHNCIPQLHRCDNTVGSYICVRIASCGTGYVLQHVTGKCEDIDECALGTHNCGSGYTCFNIRGSFRCVKRRPSTTSTTPLPEYEYVYYDSEEETDNNTSSADNETPKEPSTTTTSTTPVPEPPTTLKIPETTINTELDTKILEETPHYNPSTFPDISYSEPKNSEQPDTTPNLLVIPVPTETSVKVEIPESETSARTEIPKPEPKQTEQSISTVTQYPESEVKPTEWLPYQPKEPEYHITKTEPQPIRPVEKIPPEIPEEELPKEPDQQPPPRYKPEPNNESIPLEIETTPEISYLSPEIPNSTEKLVPSPTTPENAGNNFWNTVTVKPESCPFGFEPDEYGSCFDIDECATDRHSCFPSTEICKNTLGGYTCNCAPGFRRDHVTSACDVITTSSSTTSTTTPIPLPPTTSSESYFWGYPNYRVTSRPFHSRTMCDIGYHYNLKTLTCEDINECKNGQANCADVEICINTEGGYRCDCPPNWSLDTFRHRCVPNTRNGHLMPPGYGNEPAPFVPTKNSVPVATGTKYLDPQIIQVEDKGTVIKCSHGYRVGEDNSCIDINECETGEAKCGPQQICSNLPGGYSCNCPSGHKLIGDHMCEDVDECDIKGNLPICSQNADCVNTIGSYRCQCHAGFRSAPINDKVCVDVDECMAARPGSLCQHRCNNVWGGYRCSCHRGYKLNPDNSTCSDVDECKEFKSKLICIGKCLNEPGSYRCTCPTGYKLAEDRKSCIDIDECETGEALCSKGTASVTSNDVCVNTRGSYRCHRITCPVGYQLENKHRCNKVEKICLPTDWNCTRQPTTISYNFITFVSNLYIPEGELKLFTMKGPAWTNAKMRFQLRLLSVNAPPSVKKKASINDFLLTQQTNFEGLMSLVRPLEGPQSIELEMSMDVYTDEQFGGTAIAKLLIYVSEYDF
ncbi:unnamed protein product [Arctia plantaginis]|uniref:EGF-like domain-containing protein n=1 Tax=Arctia plantaginis TaxID=874455 RepID=A0A8S1BDS4_ARCPL|nr:unnamed protein product [Arctia plantaginis]